MAFMARFIGTVVFLIGASMLMDAETMLNLAKVDAIATGFMWFPVVTMFAGLVIFISPHS